jgi:hypothetical protein
MDLTVWPECGEVAEIQRRAVLESTDGPIEHVKILCIRRHWFMLPAAWLPGPRNLSSFSGQSDGEFNEFLL